jgi:Tfp pilus assembly protein PilO
MNRKSHRWKIMIRWTLAVLLVADLVLLGLNLRTGPSVQERHREIEQLQRQHDLLAADVRRATDIQKKLAGVQREGDEFFKRELREAASGYSSVVADLGSLAKTAGLKTSAVTFRQQELAGRGVTEVQVSATVEGDYPSLVSFINGLERSRNFYVLDSLMLASSTQAGSLKLNLQLRTYFRS